MEQNNYDEFEKMIRRKLGDEPEDASVNPPEEIFEEAMAQLPPRDKGRKRRFIPYLFIAAVLLLTSLATWYVMDNRLDDLDRQIHGINENINGEAEQEYSEAKVRDKIGVNENSENSAVDRNKETLENEDLVNSAELQKTQGSIDNNDLDGISNPGNSSSNSTNNPTTNGAMEYSPEMEIPLTVEYSDIEEAQISIEQKKENRADAEAILDLDPQEKQNPHISKRQIIKEESYDELSEGVILPTLHSKIQALETEDTTSEIVRNTDALEGTLVLCNCRERASIYFTSGMNFTALRMSSAVQEEGGLREYGKYQPGLNVHAGAKIPMGRRWQVDMGLSYSKMKSQSIYQKEMSFNHENLTIDPAEDFWRYATVVRIESPMRAMEAQADFELEDRMMTEEDKFENRVDIEGKFQAISLNTGLQYRVLNRKSLSIHAGVGMAFYYLTKMEEQMEMSISYEEQMMLQEKETYGLLDEVNRSLLTGDISLEFRYDLSPELSLLQRSSYSMGFNSMRDSDTELVGKTYPKSFNVDLGISYRF